MKSVSREFTMFRSNVKHSFIAKRQIKRQMYVMSLLSARNFSFEVSYAVLRDLSIRSQSNET